MQNTTSYNTISRNNAGFPGFLDFATLRSRSIEYLGQLTGQVWTDFNAHDPGITILEVLIYALLDLGYRTNLPAADIFARNPADTGAEDNFFTPAQILGCNPLTITDFRKLLSDIEGVRNAWLQVATEEKVPGRPSVAGAVQNCEDYINGLYHVLLELEEDLADNQPVIDQVKKTLQAHRNFCEDFIDIQILCKLDIGVCADVELEAGADANQVYQDITLKLTRFFSPAPQFYTLQELLAANKPIEEIFAGRPLQLRNSHGFIDATELEKIVIRTEIHLSDVYALLLEVPGVKTVKRLSLRSCNNKYIYQDSWKMVLPQHYLPRLSLGCSGFAFYRNGIRVPVTVEQAYLEMLAQENSKTIKAAAYLDSAMPRGVYRKELGDYYSIQNDFPRVYGIGEGGLPQSASIQRQAQALQLKGYLLFFDQLLANYLMQLKNIRSLFSLQSAAGSDGAHTYFVGLPGAVPDFNQLLRDTADGGNPAAASKTGDVLAYPVRAGALLQLVNNPSASMAETTAALEPQYFSNSALRDTAIAQWQTDFAAGTQSAPAVLALAADRFLYYFTGSDNDTALVSRKTYATEKDALDAARLFVYLGNTYEHYKGFYAADTDRFGFQVELGLTAYLPALQLIAENKEQYTTRRNAFLDHLLSRFAEQFTDYALLWYNFVAPSELPAAVVAGKEKFLAHYPDLSSNRGRAYDYTCNGWDNDNISGFEKRVKALAGIPDWTKRSLCNFEVHRYEDDYSVKFAIAGFHFFDTDTAFEGWEEATAAVQSIFTALAQPERYTIQRTEPDGLYRILLKYDAEHTAVYPETFTAEQDAQDLCVHLQRIFSQSVTAQDVQISQYIYRIRLNNDSGEQIRLSKKAYDSEAAAYAEAIGELKQVNDAEKWEITGDATPSGRFCADDRKKPEKFIDIDKFRILVNNTIIGKPDKFTYELLDNNNVFHFRALAEYANEKQARSGAYRLLMLLLDSSNYHVVPDKDVYHIVIKNGQQDMAVSAAVFNAKAIAEQFINSVLATVGRHYYRLQVEAIPFRWRFSYRLGYMKDNELLFVSNNEYPSEEEALQKARQFSDTITGARFETIAGKYSLESPDPAVGILTCTFAGEDITQEQDNTAKERKAEQLFELRKEISRQSNDTDPARFRENVTIHEISRSGAYVYRLVDKAHPLACHRLPAGTDAAEVLKQLLKTARNGYVFTEIDLGGRITEEKKDKTTGLCTWHYVIRSCKPIGGLPADTVLFESIAGYSDEAAARAAFETALLDVLDKAASVTGYGAGACISLTEPATGVQATGMPAMVYVPAQTKAWLGADDATVIAALVKIVQCYPVKRLERCSAAYVQRFGSQGCEQHTVSSTCAGKQEDYCYYFSLYNFEEDREDWQSTMVYNTATDARQAFYFCCILLQYRGNYYADECAQTIYLREVLAESARRYATAEAAWGKEGIEQLVCVIQSPGAFQPFVNRNNCSYTFSVACAGALAWHPCHYHSQSKREQVLNSLYAAAKNFVTDQLFTIVQEEQQAVLYGADSRPLAVVPSTQQPACAQVLELLDYVYCNHHYYTSEDGRFYLGRSAGDWLAKPYDTSSTQEQWRKALQELAFYYPVVRNEQGRFCVAVRLPGFNAMPGTGVYPCGCGEEQENTEAADACPVAWKSRCCFDSCTEAMEQFRTIAQQLLVYENYRPLFDCCGCTFSIALQQPAGIIAFNPQQYTTPEITCHAIERARACINTEGMHVVEHLLLRPRCEEDLQCNLFYREKALPDCHFEWHQEGETVEQVCLVPGADPFSFIATVVLPAWPARFRKKENRQLLEDLLNREAPAHVLLRVAWLRPYDFCRFEQQFKEWNKWLAGKDTCAGFTLCGFMESLFLEQWGCLEECTDCTPCKETTMPTPCMEYRRQLAAEEDPNAALNQVNRLFGWTEISCSDPVPNNTATPVPAITSQPVAAAVTATPPPAPVPAGDAAANHKQLTKLVNSRLAQYKKAIDPIVQQLQRSPLAGQVNSFLANPDADAGKLNQLVAQVLQTAAAGKAKNALKNDTRALLLQKLFAYFLDKALFKETPVDEIQTISTGIEQLKTQQYDTAAIWKAWSPDKWQGRVARETLQAVQQLFR